jgi:FtsZ-binding cell division protein ZapB
MSDYLNQLEEKINRLAGLYASVREDNNRLSVENSELKKKSEELEGENQRLMENQGHVRERVDAIIKKIEGLEDN